MRVGGESNIKEVELIIEIQIKRKSILSITLPPHSSMRENVYIWYLESPVKDQQKAAIRIHVNLGSGLMPDWWGREKSYYMVFGGDVVLPIDNLIKK